jgi:hypothetical protein
VHKNKGIIINIAARPSKIEAARSPKYFDNNSDINPIIFNKICQRFKYSDIKSNIHYIKIVLCPNLSNIPSIIFEKIDLSLSINSYNLKR